MRIATNMLYSMTRNDINSNMSAYTRAQHKLSTLKNINTLSDDPTGAGLMLNYDSTINEISRFKNNISRAESLAAIYDTSLNHVLDNLTRAQELVTAAANEASSNPAGREAYAQELMQIKQQILTTANTKYNGIYIFSGFKDKEASFSLPSANITDTGNATGEITIEDFAKITGDTYQIIFEDASTYDLINTSTGETVLDNVAYTSGETLNYSGLSITITSEPGAPQAGDIFTITTDKGCEYNGDGNIIRVEIEKDNIVPVNLVGNVVFLGEGIAGGVNVFDMFDTVVDEIRQGNAENVSDMLGEFDEFRQQILNSVVNLGARENLYETVNTRLDDYEYSFEMLLSNVQDVDVAEATIELSKTDLAYKSALLVAEKLLGTSSSLLEFLR